VIRRGGRRFSEKITLLMPGRRILSAANFGGKLDIIVCHRIQRRFQHRILRLSGLLLPFRSFCQGNLVREIVVGLVSHGEIDARNGSCR
jgi:hypothetical protein